MKQFNSQKDAIGLKTNTKSFAADLREYIDCDESLMKTLYTL